MKFTDKGIQSLKPKSERYEIWEDGKKGFGIRVTPKGGKSFIWMYRFDGKSKRLTLGQYPETSLYDAGRLLAEARDKLNQGIDPGAEVVHQRQEHRQAPLIDDVIKEYIERHAKPNKRSAFEDERILYKDVLPYWSGKKAKTIIKRDVISLLDTIVERGAGIAANRTLACVRKMFNWAVSRDILESNPCLSIKAPAKENRRDRVLSSEEIYNFWKNLDNTTMIPLSRLALKMQLVTAQRKGEVLAARWEDFDIPNKMWVIAAEVANTIFNKY